MVYRTQGRKGSNTQKIFRTVKIFCMVLSQEMHVIIHLPEPLECTEEGHVITEAERVRIPQGKEGPGLHAGRWKGPP